MSGARRGMGIETSGYLNIREERCLLVLFTVFLSTQHVQVQWCLLPLYSYRNKILSSTHDPHYVSPCNSNQCTDFYNLATTQKYLVKSEIFQQRISFSRCKLIFTYSNKVTRKEQHNHKYSVRKKNETDYYSIFKQKLNLLVVPKSKIFSKLLLQRR